MLSRLFPTTVFTLAITASGLALAHSSAHNPWRDALQSLTLSDEQRSEIRQLLAEKPRVDGVQQQRRHGRKAGRSASQDDKIQRLNARFSQQLPRLLIMAETRYQIFQQLTLEQQQQLLTALSPAGSARQRSIPQPRWLAHVTLSIAQQEAIDAIQHEAKQARVDQRSQHHDVMHRLLQLPSFDAQAWQEWFIDRQAARNRAVIEREQTRQAILAVLDDSQRAQLAQRRYHQR